MLLLSSQLALVKRIAQPIRILHIDDNAEFSDLTATFLERENDVFSVTTASSADEGLERLAETEFDCVIRDYEMPGKTGLEFLERVRERFPDLPFVYLLAKTQKKSPVRIESVGGHTIAVKSYPVREITTQIRRQLKSVSLRLSYFPT